MFCYIMFSLFSILWCSCFWKVFVRQFSIHSFENWGFCFRVSPKLAKLANQTFKWRPSTVKASIHATRTSIDRYRAAGLPRALFVKLQVLGEIRVFVVVAAAVDLVAVVLVLVAVVLLLLHTSPSNKKNLNTTLKCLKSWHCGNPDR